MKHLKLELELEKLDMPEEEKENSHELFFKYVATAFSLYQKQKQGLDVNEQRKLMNILNKLDGKTEADLEDEEFAYLHHIFHSVKWVGGTRIIVQIADKLEEAKN